MGRIYTAIFEDQAVSTALDLFQIEANTVPAIIHEIVIGQTSDVGDVEAENLVLRLRRVTDAVTAGPTEQLIDPGDAAALADVATVATALVTGAVTLRAEIWNINLPYIYLPPPEERPIVEIGNTITLNLLAAPADALQVSGTITWEEIGS